MRCPALIDDMSHPFPRAATGARWEYVADTVMGGVSSGGMTRETVSGRAANRLHGRVSLENNGGFVQMALDLLPGSGTCSAQGLSGLMFTVRGNEQTYNVHIRTGDVSRPWQSYRATFRAPQEWTTVSVSFADLTPHRIEAPFDARRLRRIGFVAIGREMTADLAVARLEFTS